MPLRRLLPWALVFVAVNACHRAAADAPTPTVAVVPDTISQEVAVVGRFELRAEVAVVSPIAGIVRALFVHAGDTVHEGQLLARVAVIAAPAAIASAHSDADLSALQLAEAQRSFAVADSLHRRGFLSDDNWAAQKARRHAAEIRHVLARERLALVGALGASDSAGTPIRAPANGVIVERLVDIGSPVVALGALSGVHAMMTIADPTDIVFRGEVDETDIAHLRPGIPVRYTVSALPHTAVQGTLRWLSLKGVPNERDGGVRFGMRATVDAVAPARHVPIGSSAVAHIRVAAFANALVVPERALVFVDDHPFLWVLPRGEGPAERRPVRIGLANGTRAQVLAGVVAGDRVLTMPPARE